MNSPPPYTYRRGELFVDQVPLGDIARELGTPLYVYSASKIHAQFMAFDRAFGAWPHTLCYAMKANGSLAVLRLLSNLGAGADIVSGGELFKALKAGVPAGRIVFSGVGKTENEMAAALEAGILMFNVESIEEMKALQSVAKRLHRPAGVSVRVNPNVAADTHHHIATGKHENKFGLPLPQAEELYRQAARMPWVRLVGVQAHIGSQILNVRPFGETAKILLGLVKRLAASGIHLQVLDLGGGLGVSYNGEKAPQPADLAKILLPLVRGSGLRLVFEPGRYMVAEAGCLVTRVLYRKETGHKNFVIVDAAMNDLARPALYDAYHPIWAVRAPARKAAYTADVVGPICESGDFLAKGRDLKHRPVAGDALAVMCAGAYGFAMGSQYNARPRPPEVMVRGAKWWVVRERETQSDLTRGETIPEALR